MSQNTLLVPFLNQDPTYCYGVELGMQILAPMLRGKRCIEGYFRTENEEQIRLCCYRMGYEVAELEPWFHEDEETGWVWMKLRKTQEAVA